MRGNIPWDEEPEVNNNVVVCSFLPESSSTIATQRPCSAGYRLHLSDSKLELYNRQRSDTFIFINRQLGTEVVVSIALQKISSTVQRASLISSLRRNFLGLTSVLAIGKGQQITSHWYRIACGIQS